MPANPLRVLLVAAPYLAAWLAVVLCMLDPSPLRITLLLCALAASLGIRLASPRSASWWAACCAALGLLVALGLTSSSLAGLGRALLGALGGAIGLYCCVRAWRG